NPHKATRKEHAPFVSLCVVRVDSLPLAIARGLLFEPADVINNASCPVSLRLDDGDSGNFIIGVEDISAVSAIGSSIINDERNHYLPRGVYFIDDSFANRAFPISVTINSGVRETAIAAQ